MGHEVLLLVVAQHRALRRPQPPHREPQREGHQQGDERHAAGGERGDARGGEEVLHEHGRAAYRPLRRPAGARRPAERSARGEDRPVGGPVVVEHALAAHARDRHGDVDGATGGRRVGDAGW